MTTPSANATATLTYTVSIEAPPAAVWDAITTPEQSDRYGYKGRVEYALRPGGRFAHHPGDEMAAHGSPDPLIDGEVLEVDAPHRLVQTWNPLFGPPVTEEPSTRIAYEIKPVATGGTKVTLSHELDGANYSTEGHLLVIVGFTEAGDVIVNDPASRDDRAVRHVYKRQQFADVWLRTTGSSSGGVAYLIKPPSMAWPSALLSGK